MTDKPFVKVTAGFYLKNVPKEHLGISSETWTFGKEPMSLDELILAVVVHLCEFYANVMPDDLKDINAAIKKAGEAIGGLEMEGI